MWNKDRSLLLSKFCVCLFTVIGILICVGAPWLVRILTGFRGEYLLGKETYLLISAYSLAVFAFRALYALHQLLANIGKDESFIEKNVELLRNISWNCIGAGIICLISSLYYLPFLLIAMMAAFVGLILRVVKNVFAEAVRLKTENDYTI